MSEDVTLKELIEKVNRQEDTVYQLIKMVARTNYLITELQLKQKDLEGGNKYH